MTSTILYLLCILIGGVSGLRSLTGIAIVTIAAQRGWPHLGWLHLGGTGLSFLAKPVAMYIFVVLAIGELIADKLPFVPPRIQAGPLAARFVLGALCGSALAVAAGMPWIFPAAIGGVGRRAGSLCRLLAATHHYKPRRQGPADCAARRCYGDSAGAVRCIALLSL